MALALVARRAEVRGGIFTGALVKAKMEEKEELSSFSSEEWFFFSELFFFPFHFAHFVCCPTIEEKRKSSFSLPRFPTHCPPLRARHLLTSLPCVMATTAPAARRASFGANTTAADAAATTTTTTPTRANADDAPLSSSDLAFQTALVLEWLAERSAGSDNVDALVAALAEAQVRTGGREGGKEK